MRKFLKSCLSLIRLSIVLIVVLVVANCSPKRGNKTSSSVKKSLALDENFIKDLKKSEHDDLAFLKKIYEDDALKKCTKIEEVHPSYLTKVTKKIPKGSRRRLLEALKHMPDEQNVIQDIKLLIVKSIEINELSINQMDDKTKKNLSNFIKLQKQNLENSDPKDATPKELKEAYLEFISDLQVAYGL